jgi:hypothetical protein
MKIFKQDKATSAIMRVTMREYLQHHPFTTDAQAREAIKTSSEEMPINTAFSWWWAEK